ncbi:MAG: hypothetical protein ACOYYS_22185 [Chloroflexota bacterium]
MKHKRLTTLSLPILIAIAGICLWLVAMSTTNAAANRMGQASPEVIYVHFPPGPWPWYAQEEISVYPEPPLPERPVDVCAEVVNDDTQPRPATLKFGVAPLGIALNYEPVGETTVMVPPGGHTRGCVGWVPPHGGSWGIEVLLYQPGEIEPLRSQRNIDLDEPLQPGIAHERLFRVRNPMAAQQTITLEMRSNLDLVAAGWLFELSQIELLDMAPGEERDVFLTVTPPIGHPMPPDGEFLADVEGWILDENIGGFRKIFRPPVALHRSPDPFYAESEISVFPYPPQAGEPMEVCVELYNPTPDPREVTLLFSWANFGIGLPFTPFDEPVTIVLPPHSMIRHCVHWVSPTGGHICLQAELLMEGYQPQRSQRNLDVNEPLLPGVPHSMTFLVGNPRNEAADVTLGLIPHIPGWGIELSQNVITGLAPHAVREVTLTVTPPAGVPLPPDGHPIVDVEAAIQGELIGGFRKVFRPPVPLHVYPDPPYAEREISIQPYPPKAGEPTEICVELRNPTDQAQDVRLQFSWANFGIGLPFQPIGGLQVVHLPPHSIVKKCIHWVPPMSGHLCVQVALFMENYPPQRSQRNLDVDEPLKPGEPHTRFFPVGNPLEHPVTITLGLVPHLPAWGMSLSTDILRNMQPGEVREVALTVTPTLEMPEDQHPVVDVEAFAAGHLIGGFRKVFRPPVPIHRPKDPIYAESEIFIHPYPPRAFEPTQVGAEIFNPTEEEQPITITFSAANFGIGLPFHPIHEPIRLVVPPKAHIFPDIVWLPPHGGLWCIQIELEMPGLERIFFSQRNIDVGEPFEPLVAHGRPFLVRNPLSRPATVTLGLIPHLPGWIIELSQDVLVDMAPGEVREVILTVTPPEELPPDEFPVVDVEAYIKGRLIGGFRKIYRPPVPIHRPKDPIYAESEIGVDPYPVLPGQPVQLSVEVFNPTDQDRIVEATFSVAHFGIGLPFSTANIVPNPIQVYVPARGAARGFVVWTPPQWRGKFCVRVELVTEGHEPVWSQRNIDVGEPLEPGEPHSMTFAVGAWPHQEAATVTLGLINYREGWQAALSQDTLVDVRPGNPVSITLTVTPSLGAALGDGGPIVDVVGFVDGEIIGGFRKLNIPPFPLHKPHEKNYAESEILIDPYPPMQGQPVTVSTVIQNNGDFAETIDVAFYWAKFGMGIPFTNTFLAPPIRSVNIGAHMTQTVWTTWTPQYAGSQCVEIELHDPEGIYQTQYSQRNVHVERNAPCNHTSVFSFTVYNDSPFSATVDTGLITFNVPPDWQITVTPSPTLELAPFSEGIVTVSVLIPCPPDFLSRLSREFIQIVQAASGSVPTIDVEGYAKGVLLGGIELQFPDNAYAPLEKIYLPTIYH